MDSRSIEETVHRIEAAGGWEQRIQEIRRIPERHGREEQPAVYAAVAGRLYRPHLSASFAFVPVREDYEPESFARAYGAASATRFNVTVRPAPDFVVFEPPRSLRARTFTLRTLPDLLEVQPFPGLVGRAGI
jgi:hypothetical protein